MPFCWAGVATTAKVYHVIPPWELCSKHSTQDFEAASVTLMRAIRVIRGGQILGENDSRMWRMLFAHKKAAHAPLSFNNVVLVGSDEINWRKRHNYLKVFACMIAKRTIFATYG